MSLLTMAMAATKILSPTIAPTMIVIQMNVLTKPCQPLTDLLVTIISSP